MATIQEYYEKDFSNCVRVFIRYPINGAEQKGCILYDFSGYLSFLAFYIPDANKDLAYFKQLLSGLTNGVTQVFLDERVTLPLAKSFPGKLKIVTAPNFEIHGQFLADPQWISNTEIKSSQRIFLYSESDLTQQEILELKSHGKNLQHDIQFRSKQFQKERGMFETPLAFISHDSRNKDDVARPIARNLQAKMCPVWYDEYSLKVGDNLRDSIEKGLKECKKCVLVLSKEFIGNAGWTKKEFDSIFTREILEEKKLVLPVWFDVEKSEVYNYSPSLLNIKGLNWNKLGEEDVCRQLYNAIVD